MAFKHTSVFLGALSYKLDIIKRMNLDDVTAVIPLLQFSTTKLRDLAALAEKEFLEVPYSSRIKYTSEKLQVHFCSICINMSIIDILLICVIFILC